jgi:predicted transcriptional regulator
VTSPVKRVLAVVLVVMLAGSLTVGAGTALASGQAYASDGTDEPVGLFGYFNDTVDQVDETANETLEKSNGTSEESDPETDETTDGSDSPDDTADGNGTADPDETSNVESGADEEDASAERTEEPVDDAEESTSGAEGDDARTADSGTSESDSGEADTVPDETSSVLDFESEQDAESDGGAADEVTDATDHETNSTASPGDDADGAATETANATNATETDGIDGLFDGLAGGTTDGVDESTGDSDGSLDGTVQTVENATNVAVANETEGGVTEGAGSTVDRTGEDATDATTDLESVANETVDAVGGGSAAGDSAKAVVNETVAIANAVVENGTETTVTVVETTDAAREDLTELVEETAAAIERTTDEVTDDVDRNVSGTFSRQDGTAEAKQLRTAEWNGSAEPTDEGPVETETTSDQDNATAAEPPAGTPGIPRGGADPSAGGALLGALLVAGAAAVTRTGLSAVTGGAGAGVTLPQLAFAMLKEWLLRLAVLAGYSRYDFEDPFENENRATLYETVEESPGINLTSLVEETGLAESTVRYHLRVLEHEGEIEATKVRGRRRYVPKTGGDIELVAALEEDATKEVLEALLENEPATGTALADTLEKDKSTVSHHLSRLSEAGLVEREPDGPALMNSLCPRIRQALEPVEVTSSVQQHARADD